MPTTSSRFAGDSVPVAVSARPIVRDTLGDVEAAVLMRQCRSREDRSPEAIGAAPAAIAVPAATIKIKIKHININHPLSG